MKSGEIITVVKTAREVLKQKNVRKQRSMDYPDIPLAEKNKEKTKLKLLF